MEPTRVNGRVICQQCDRQTGGLWWAFGLWVCWSCMVEVYPDLVAKQRQAAGIPTK